MGLFSNLSKAVEDLKPIGDFEFKDGSYQFQIDDITVKTYGDESKMPGQTGISVKLLCLDGDNEDMIGMTYTDFLRVPDDELQGSTAEFFGRVLKSHFMWFGVPESVLDADEFDPEDEDQTSEIIGAIGLGTIKTNKKGFQNLTAFELEEDSGEKVATNSADGSTDDELSDVKW